MNWKFTDGSERVVSRINDQGLNESCSVEAIEYLRWLNGWTEVIRAPGTWTPEVPATLDDDGNELTPLIPGYWTEGEIIETIVHEPNTPEPYVPPPTPVPQVISMRQARLALLGVGLLGMVDQAINAQDEPIKSKFRIEWDYATEVNRNWPTLLNLMPALGLTDAQVDQLFMQASQL